MHGVHGILGYIASMGQGCIADRGMIEDKGRLILEMRKFFATDRCGFSRMFPAQIHPCKSVHIRGQFIFSA
jgi:hypothetical protein